MSGSCGLLPSVTTPRLAQMQAYSSMSRRATAAGFQIMPGMDDLRTMTGATYLPGELSNALRQSWRQMSSLHDEINALMRS